jgi:mannosyltransferase
LFDRRTAFYTCLLAGTSLYDLWFAQEARQYALAGLLTVGSTLCLVRALENPSALRLAAYAFSIVLLLYTHYVAIFLVAAHCAIILRTHLVTRMPIYPWAVSGVAIASAIAPWISVAITQAGSATKNLWVPHPNVTDLALLPLNLFSYRWPFSKPLTLAIAVVVSTALAFVLDRRAELLVDRPSLKRQSLPDVLLWAVLPALLAFAVSQRSVPVFLPKTMIVTAGGWYLLMGKAIRSIGSGSARVAIVGAVAALSVQSYPWYFGSHHKENWRRAAAIIDSRFEQGDAVECTAPHTRLALDHYSRSQYSLDRAAPRKWIVITGMSREQVQELVSSERSHGDKVLYRKSVTGIELILVRRGLHHS